VFLQRVVVVAGLVAERAHEVGSAGVRCHVSPERRFSSETFSAFSAREISFTGVRYDVRHQVVTVGKDFVAVMAGISSGAAFVAALCCPSVF
jgi:hypothetical protein